MLLAARAPLLVTEMLVVVLPVPPAQQVLETAAEAALLVRALRVGAARLSFRVCQQFPLPPARFLQLPNRW
jgi:hypothetical protein